MTLQNLLENAHLDALGLLDERELVDYNAAFASAPPEVQSHIRAEQARWANLDFLLPRVEPPEHLRARVLAAVQAAMLEADEVTPESTMRPAIRVSRGWRTTSMGLLAVSVVLGGAFVAVMGQNAEMSRSMSAGDVQREVFGALGGDKMNDTFFSLATSRVHFKPVSPTFAGQASLLHNDSWDNARLVCLDLPVLVGQTYRVAILDAQGEVTEQLAELPMAASPNIQPKLSFINLSAAGLKAGTKIALIAAGRGADAATGTIVMTATI